MKISLVKKPGLNIKAGRKKGPAQSVLCRFVIYAARGTLHEYRNIITFGLSKCNGIIKIMHKNTRKESAARFANLFNNGGEGIAVDRKQPIAFRNGYASNSPYFVTLCSCREDFGKPEWGAEHDKKYFVLTIHEIINPDALNDLKLK